MVSQENSWQSRVLNSPWSPVSWVKFLLKCIWKAVAYSYAAMVVAGVVAGFAMMLITPFFDIDSLRAQPMQEAQELTADEQLYERLSNIDWAFALDFLAPSLLDDRQETPTTCLLAEAHAEYSDPQNNTELYEQIIGSLKAKYSARCELALMLREVAIPEMERIVAAGVRDREYFSFGIYLDESGSSESTVVGPFISMGQCSHFHREAIDKGMVTSGCNQWKPRW